MTLQDHYQKAIKFAGQKHADANQVVPGTKLPYVVHISNVAMEILVAMPHSADMDAPLAITLALLHDTLEDTDTTIEELTVVFSTAVADGVVALTKKDDLDKSAKMSDSLDRIKAQPKEVWAVKLADRITNLQVPPAHWSGEKIANYHQEAITILNALKGGNAYLEQRLSEKIVLYAKYFQ
jgi:guanosine-3',5'-bis(diphosphate) 3'-pyrophosphohydrolase